MESRNNVKKGNNKNTLVLGIVIAVVVIAVILILVLRGGASSKTVTATLGEAQWMDVGQTLKFTDGDNNVTFTVTTEDNLVKTDEDYEYTISYVLTVNETEYTGTHRFGNGYSVHNEDNDIPYAIDIIDFEDNTIEVSFTANQAE